MKRRRSSETYRRERIIMIACSVLTLTAITVTGISVYQSSQTRKQEENIVDFSVLEDEDRQQEPLAQAQNSDVKNYTSTNDPGELDYDPYYAAKDALLNDADPDKKANNAGTSGEEETQSKEGETGDETQNAAETGTVGYSEISGTTVINGRDELTSVHENNVQGAAEEAETGSAVQSEEGAEQAAAQDTADTASGDALTAEETNDQVLEAVANAMQEEMNLQFDENTALAWPIVGNVLLNYSMDKTVYFQTLQQYKYNPSIVIGATQGTNVACAADGIVKSIYDDPQTGTTVVMNLGNGYELTYGQLTDISVEEGDLVEAGVFIGKVAAPTKYYTKEGTNIYLKLTRDQEPVNPLDHLG